MPWRRLLFPAALLVAAWGLRLLYLSEYHASPFFDAPIVDAFSFYKKSSAIAAGQMWGESEAFWQPPLYIYWLALFHWLTPDHFFLSTRLAQTFLGAFSCLLTYLIARRVLSPAVAALAGGLAACYGVSFYFETELLAVSLEVCLDLALVHRLLIALERPQSRHWLAAGILAGLAALTRPTVLLYIAVVPVWIWWRSQRGQALAKASGPGWIQVGLFIFTCILVILPVSWRNYHIDGDWVPISTNGGINFFIGNNPNYDGTVNIRPGMPWEELVMEPVRAGYTSAAQRSTYFTRKGLDYIVDQPLAWSGLLLKKLYLFWAAPEIKRNQDVYYARTHSFLLSALLWDWGGFSFPFGLIGPLALVGLAATWRRSDPPLALLRLFTLSYIGAVVLFFVVARYRMPVLPVLLIFAAWTLSQLYTAIKTGHRSRALVLGLPTLLLAVACNLPAVPPLSQDAEVRFHLGEVFLRQEKYPLAAQYSLACLELEPSFNYARHNLAVAYFHLGDYDAALEAGIQTSKENPRRADTHVLLGRVQTAVGNPGAAVAHFRRALAIDPKDGMGHYYYGRVLAAAGKASQAAEHFEQARNAFPQDFWLAYELAQAYQFQGQLDQALAGFAAAYRLEPQAAALNAMGAIHFQRGDLDQARQHFDRALTLAPNDPDAGVNRAVIDLKKGQAVQAATALEKILRRHPDFRRAAAALAEAYRRTGRPKQAQALENRLTKKGP
jgi:tetratricopeptide (TPR) repeat protein